ncbi:MFS transporter [Pseudomonas sp. LS1212]|uniref:spinster family MFS transporter n=1 Tax=Pseudomonas sp. LS1212 TaxID=2972478 RepID=UPI00215B89A9|nr:MFS transporter [Pseudomonas sp. LS1212]UVJ45725.1 MFS transporter [Pseudomonas sp. LS1212]
MLVLVYASSFMDRIIMATVGQAVKEDLQLSDLQLGLLGGLAFALFYTVLGLPIARFAERRSRVRIIASCVIVWSTMTALCGTASNFVQLLLFRMGVGVGEAGCVPAAHSLIADHFPRERRATALALFSLGVPLGAAGGAVLGGWMVQHYGWREAFYVMGLPGIALGLLVYATLREPQRGLSEECYQDSDNVPSFVTVLKRLFGLATFRRISLGAGLGGFAVYGINLFIPVYMIRAFDMSYTKAGLMFAIISGGAGMIGGALGGVISDWAGRRGEKWYGWVPALSFLAAAPCYVVGFLQESWQLSVVWIAIGCMFVMFHQPPTFAVTQNLAEPRMRASASAILLFVLNLIGMGLGPLFIGLASDLYAARAFSLGDYSTLCPGGMAPANAEAILAQACHGASVIGLRSAIVTCAGGFILAAMVYYLAGRSMARDLNTRVHP